MLTALIYYKANIFIIVDFYFHDVFCFSVKKKNKQK